MKLVEVAMQYRKAGLSIIPCRNKKPALETWSAYQETPVTDEEIKRLFGSGWADEIAIVTGMVSGGLELIDVDLKFDTTGNLWDLLWNDLLEYFNNTMPLLVVNTRSKGVHLYYRCEKPAGNQHLAKQVRGGQAVIETRGEGGYVIAPPSVGYSFANPEQTMEDIKVITQFQRDDIIDICRKYNKVFTEVKKKSSNIQASVYKETPWDAYNVDQDDPWISVMNDYGWEATKIDLDGKTHYKRPGSENLYGANWDPEKRLLYVFTPNGGFESEKAYSPFAIYAFLKCAGDFSLASKEIRAAGYGKPFSDKEEKFIGRAKGLVSKFDFFDIERMLAFDWGSESPELNDLSKTEKEEKISADLQPVIKAAANRLAAEKGLFWRVEKKGVVKIASDGMVLFLRDHGFKLFVQESNSMIYRLVQVDSENNLIDEIPEDGIMKWVEQWVNENIEDYEVNHKALLLALYEFSGWSHLLKWMPRLSLKDVSFLRDTKHSCYIPFRNGIIHITKNDMQHIQYSALPDGMLVWKNQIKPKDIEIMGIEEDIKLNESPVFLFIKRVAGIMPENENLSFDQLRVARPYLHTRLLSFLSVAGYLMSNYKDPGTPYAVILAEDTASDKKGGGAGKDLYMKCLGLIRGISYLPGKLWKATASFAFQTYKLGDDILYIGDPSKYFDFEALYNTISEGLTVEKKNKDALVIPYELSPKVVISTNYMIDDSSEHASRRQVKLLFTKYYSRNLRVQDELGGDFWSSEWTHRDWMLFYLLMFSCIQLFIDGGVVVTDSTENAKEKSVKQQYTEEFFSFMQMWMPDHQGKWVDYSEMYRMFLDDSSNNDKSFKPNRFTYALEFYANSYGLVLTDRRKKNETGKYLKYVIFTKPGEQVPETVYNTPF